MKPPTRTRGSVSTFCLLAMTVLLIGSIGVAGLGAHGLKRAGSDRRAATAFQATQAALEVGATRAFGYANQNRAAFPTAVYDLTEALQAIAPGCTASANVQPVPNDTAAWITTSVTFERRTHSLRALLRAKDVGVWNNAIFAGIGESGKAINGNVTVRGSVHIVGEGEAYTDLNGNGKWDDQEAFTDKNKNAKWDAGEPFTDSNGDGVWSAREPYNDQNRDLKYNPPLTQADLSTSFDGDASIGNNYSGLDPLLRATVVDPPKVGDRETLHADIRVKHGRVQLTGSAMIGTNQLVDLGLSKGTMDGSFVNDGYAGSVNNVYSDNGTKNAYDLDGRNIRLPIISGIGASTYTDATGTVWENQEAYYLNRALLVNMTALTPNTTSFTQADVYGNTITFTRETSLAPAILEVQGVVRVLGDLAMNGNMRFKGNGTVYVPGQLTFGGNLLPVDGLKFPNPDARLGWVAKGDIVLGTSAILDITGAFYAQGRVKAMKKARVMGTIMGTFFDLGTNNPSLYQVPALARNMPPAMPGDVSIVVMKIRSWREK